MAKQLLSLCAIPKLATRDGYSGPNAKLYLPFSSGNGYWFASGQQYVWPNALIPQDRELSFSGTWKPNTFQKDCCSCLNP